MYMKYAIYEIKKDWVRGLVVPSTLYYAASPPAVDVGLGATAQKGHKAVREYPKEYYKGGEGPKGLHV